MRRLLVLLATLCAAAVSLGLLPGPAVAASLVGMYPETSKGPGGITFYGDGQPSDLTAYRTGGTIRPAWRLHDPSGITLASPHFDCVSVDPATVECSDVYELDVGLGSHGGRIAVEGEPASYSAISITGGAGDDVVTTGPGISAAYFLSGGRDTFTAASGRATVWASTVGLRDPTEIDLAAGTARRGDDLTTMSGVDYVVASGANHVIGTDGPDDVYSEGGGYTDTGGGDDVLWGSGTFRAGPGDDAVTLKGAADVSCGPGLDEVSLSPYTADLADDCERIHAFSDRGHEHEQRLDPRPHRVTGAPTRLRFRVFCGRTAAGRCHGSLRVGDGSAQSRVRVDVARGRYGWATLHTPRGRRVKVGTRLEMRLSGDGIRAREWTAPVIP